ncbi:MAG: SDR family NAD(P)-dependent oxidoreductase, partial [Candidatus Tectomicrobia bacterium]
VCRDHADAIAALTALDSKRMVSAARPPEALSVVFMFPGQGTQYVNMGRELYDSEPIFREQIDACCDVLASHMGLDLRDILYPSDATADVAEAQLRQTEVTQPALFAIEYALATLWMAWGVTPAAMIGHSIGEYVAACLAGVFSLEDALSLVATRGKLLQRLPTGSMLAVPLSAAELQPDLTRGLSLAAVNAPMRCVVSGDDHAISQLASRLAAKGVQSRLLQTSHAFHSSMLDPVLPAFTQAVQRVAMHAPQIPYLSNVTGTWIEAAQATDRAYWAQHLRQAVQFAAGIDTLVQEPRIWLEVGPGHALSTLVRQRRHQEMEQRVLTSGLSPQGRTSELADLLTTLGHLWLAGGQIDWTGFYIHERRRRLPLPTYPFERQRYWVTGPIGVGGMKRVESESRTPSALQKRLDVADWLYLPSWQRSQSLRPATAERYCWLLFEDASSFSREIERQLRQHHHDVVVVHPGQGFQRLQDGRYQIDPQSKADYVTLISGLYDADQRPQKIIHCWSMMPSAPCDAVGFYSLLFLAQALTDIQRSHAVQICVVSNDTHDVTGEEDLCPEAAMVWSVCKGIPQEFPSLACCSVDISRPAPGSRDELQMVVQLIAEVSHERLEPVVAYRRDHRWVQTFEPMRLAPPEASESGLRHKGVYLITGGLGNIGLELADYLARTVQAKLILTGRSAFPPRDAWAEWLQTHAAEDGTSQKIQRLQAMEAQGANVLIAQADVANREDMQAVLETARQRFGLLHGVFHGAAVTGQAVFRTIRDTERRDCEQQFRPKIQGLKVLQEVLPETLDFGLVFSSLSSILGGLGLTAYAAANSFMDAFVHSCKRTGSVPWISVNWDGWHVGDEMELDDTLSRTLATMAMSPEEGLEALHRILSRDVGAQVIVSTSTIQARFDRWVRLTSQSLAGFGDDATSAPRHLRPSLKTAYVAPRSEVEATVAQIWQELLGVQDVGVHDNFFELSGDSLLAIQLNTRLRDSFHVEFSVNTLFEDPTIAKMAELIQVAEEVGHGDVSDIEAKLAMIEQLSDEDVQKLLAEMQDE